MRAVDPLLTPGVRCSCDVALTLATGTALPRLRKRSPRIEGEHKCHSTTAEMNPRAYFAVSAEMMVYRHLSRTGVQEPWAQHLFEAAVD